jgi:hypothetical protein
MGDRFEPFYSRTDSTGGLKADIKEIGIHTSLTAFGNPPACQATFLPLYFEKNY